MTYVPETLRMQVYQRASGVCEYCLLHERYTIKRHEIDHIFAEKHGGKTSLENLCLSCFDCNRYKGSDLASLDEDEVVTLFHPRRQLWLDNFRLNGPLIEPLTAHGRVTVSLLRLNSDERIEERQTLLRLGRYP